MYGSRTILTLLTIAQLAVMGTHMHAQAQTPAAPPIPVDLPPLPLNINCFLSATASENPEAITYIDAHTLLQAIQRELIDPSGRPNTCSPRMSNGEKKQTGLTENDLRKVQCVSIVEAGRNGAVGFYGKGTDADMVFEKFYKGTELLWQCLSRAKALKSSYVYATAVVMEPESGKVTHFWMGRDILKERK